ncbi:MAG: filamentous hemagglutinin N-terminal domain-containing protein, partial [Cyanobacteria bacterium J06559_3]
MQPSSSGNVCRIGFATVLGTATLCSPSWGQPQIAPDDTLGAETSTLGEGVIEGNPVQLIEGGAARGSNLFHSFSEFNVGSEAVYFANPAGIENILSRVTGSNVSHINGLLGVDGAANLFLLNPNGVLFGSNAQLDINGAFAVSTAESLIFADGNEFRVVPDSHELLSISVPLGLQLNRPTHGDITSMGSLVTGQDLTLQGQDLHLEGQLVAGGALTLQAADTVTIRSPATDAFLAQSGDELTIQGNREIDIGASNHPSPRFESGSDLMLLSDAMIAIDAHFISEGSFSAQRLSGDLADVVSLGGSSFIVDGDYAIGNYTGASLQVIA